MGTDTISTSKMTDGPCMSPLGVHTASKYDKGDQSSGGETTWTNTGATRSGRGLNKIAITWRWHTEAFTLACKIIVSP